MADALLDTVRDALEGQIDFEGQRLAEQLNTNLLSIIGAIAFILGYFTQNIQYTLYTGLAGSLLAALIIVPPWPFFNKHPVRWLASARTTGTQDIKITQS